MPHLLVTNDFPPKIGGIQSYLWELWRRLPPSEVTVLTTSHRSAAEFDKAQAFRIVRQKTPVLLPTPLMARRIRRLAGEVGAKAVVLDPVLPLGLIGPRLALPYAVVLHGSEISVPGRLPATRSLVARVVSQASLAIAAGGYPEREARHAVGTEQPFPPVIRIPPGVDTARFRPLAAIDRAAARARLQLPAQGPLVVSVSRLVPRKGMDTLIQAAARLAPSHPELTVVISGAGRDLSRLRLLVRRSGAPVRLIGRVSDLELPALYGCADVFAMCCRRRWAGLEQEGFGIVFLEAAACGVASIAGDSGGAAEAVVSGSTGYVVDHADDPKAVAVALGRLLDDPAVASQQGQAARARAEEEFDYDTLAGRLEDALAQFPGGPM
ncbi:MAG: phosphatidyl-myo-inositol dimannoside synthase [Acidimicrobiaceae bacterium]|nr:phosphatidyl-myo-inositol dimannoside synthase [Acidimicrobiaceae bacterium]